MMNETKHKEKTIQIIESVYELYEKTFPVTFEEAEAFDNIFNNLLIIEELEEIKKEVETYYADYDLSISETVSGIIDKHIYELKGENK